MVDWRQVLVGIRARVPTVEDGELTPLALASRLQLVGVDVDRALAEAGRQEGQYPMDEWGLDEDPSACPSGAQIVQQCVLLASTLLRKNRKYGDSALCPIRVFSRADALEQINVRLDDKLSRLVSGQADEDEDVEDDILGYLILKRIARLRAQGLLAGGGSR